MKRFEKYRMYIKKGSLLCLFTLFFLIGCQKIDQLPQLEIVVQDESGLPVGGATVGLFNTYEEWLSLSNPVQVWRATDSKGSVLFIDLEEAKYFIYVRKGSQDNTPYEIELSDALEMNTKMHAIIHIK